jgi:hypothetical protein
LAEEEWSDVPAEAVAGWNRRLLDTDASLHQYPYWNAPYRRVGWTPHTLVLGSDAAPAAYACVLSFGVPGFRIGLLHRGPVWLAPTDAEAARERVSALLRWARRRGLAFLRVTHTDAEQLAAAAAAGHSERIDSFPLHRGDPKADLIVHLPEAEGALCASFRKDARREIRRDLARGYELGSTDAPEALAALWPMFEAHAHRRGFRHFRSLRWWLEVMREARPAGCARLFIASRRRVPVAADLCLRDRSSVRSITAWDEAALGDEPSPSTFLAWHAMSELRRAGVREFTLGPSRGSLLVYKRRFRPAEVVHPAPVTLIVHEGRYGIWRRAVLPMGAVFRRGRRVLARV